MELIFNPIQDISFIRQIHFIVVSSYDYLSFINRAKIYKHRFSIEEDDQFEIHVKDYRDKFFIGEEDMYKVAEEVILKVNQGSSGFVYLIIQYQK